MMIRRLNVTLGLLLMTYALYYLVLTVLDIRVIHESSTAWFEVAEDDKALFLTFGLLLLNILIALGIAFSGFRHFTFHNAGLLAGALGFLCLILASGIIGKLLALGVIFVQFCNYKIDKNLLK